MVSQFLAVEIAKHQAVGWRSGATARWRQADSKAMQASGVVAKKRCRVIAAIRQADQNRTRVSVANAPPASKVERQGGERAERIAKRVELIAGEIANSDQTLVAKRLAIEQ